MSSSSSSSSSAAGSGGSGGRTPVTVFGIDVSPHIEKLPPSLRPLATTALTAQFAWWLGHVITVIETTLFVLFRRTKPSGPSTYSWALLGTILAYTIVVYKAHVTAYLRSLTTGQPTSLSGIGEKLLKDENAQYGILAIMLLFSKAYTPFLIPYFTFSLFHVATYAYRTLIPKLFPASLQSLSPPLKTFVDNYQQSAITAVAYCEVVLLPFAILIGLFPRWVRLTTPFFYGQFLLQRYRASSTTKRAFRAARLQADKYLDVPSVPEGVRRGYLVVRDGLERLGGGVRAAETPAGTQGTQGAASEGEKRE